MGVKIESLGLDNAQKYRENIQTIGDFIQHRGFSPHLYYDFTYWLSGKMKALSEFTGSVRAFTSKIIKERRFMSPDETRPTQNVDHDNVLVFIKI